MLLIIIIQVFYAFCDMFLACELGQRINIAFDECGEMIDQFDWYLLPAKIQRILPLIINFAQQPVNIKCFGSSACDRETFKYVSIIKSIVRNYEIISLEIIFFQNIYLNITGYQDGILIFYGAPQIL